MEIEKPDAAQTDIFNRAEDEDFHHLETGCMLSTGKGEFAEFIAKLFGTEVYFYRKSHTQSHEFMHTLVGTFVNIQDPAEKEGYPTLYPVNIALPPKYSRTVYFMNTEDQEKWAKVLRKVSETYNLEDFYEVIKDLGEGSMGVVKLAKHKKTGEEFAVKCMKKAKKSEAETLLQKREIEALKLCQHPNLIHMQDLFETSSHYYIVIEMCSGGDMYDYLERRNFRISEERAWELASQLSGAVFYLHNFNIIHRDLKLENVMMTDDTEQSIPKVVDFGLSALVEPGQAAKESVGTVAYAAPEIF